MSGGVSRSYPPVAWRSRVAGLLTTVGSCGDVIDSVGVAPAAIAAGFWHHAGRTETAAGPRGVSYSGQIIDLASFESQSNFYRSRDGEASRNEFW